MKRRLSHASSLKKDNDTICDLGEDGGDRDFVHFNVSAIDNEKEKSVGDINNDLFVDINRSDAVIDETYVVCRTEKGIVEEELEVVTKKQSENCSKKEKGRLGDKEKEEENVMREDVVEKDKLKKKKKKKKDVAGILKKLQERRKEIEQVKEDEVEKGKKNDNEKAKQIEGKSIEKENIIEKERDNDVNVAEKEKEERTNVDVKVAEKEEETNVDLKVAEKEEGSNVDVGKEIEHNKKK